MFRTLKMASRSAIELIIVLVFYCNFENIFREDQFCIVILWNAEIELRKLTYCFDKTTKNTLRTSLPNQCVFCLCRQPFLSDDSFVLEGHGASVWAVSRRISSTGARRAQMSIHIIKHLTNVTIVQQLYLSLCAISH